MEKRPILILMILSLVLILACGGGGGGGTDTGGGTGGDNGGGGGGGTPTEPAISGFDFTLSQGDFWEYRWDYYQRTADAYGSDTTRDIGRFRVVLGSPVTIDGKTAYTVLCEGLSGGTDGSDTWEYCPRWNYIAMEDSRIYGSETGSSLSLIFDAFNGYWAGGGFFSSFGNSSLTTAQSGTIDNDYLTSSAIKIGTSSSQSQCEYVAGILICGDDSYTYTKNDYFKANVGPLGHYYYNNHYFGGTYPSTHTWTENVGLVESSFQGDVADHTYETEPNNSSTAADVLTLGEEVIGFVDEFDTNTSLNIELTAGNFTNFKFQDWYKFTLPTNLFTMGVYVSLDFTGADPDTDLDIFLFNSSITQALEWSNGDNASTGVQTEGINISLGTGTYYVGVSAWNTNGSVDGGNVEYKLRVNRTF